MTQHETALSFDILSYPREAIEDGVILETDAAPEADQLFLPQVYRVGSNAVRTAVPHAADAYASIARGFGLSPDKTMLVSDQQGARVALQNGMGVATVSNKRGATTTLDLLRSPQSITDQTLYENPLYSDLAYADVAEALYTPGQIRVVGFVGRTGAGKSTTINRLVDSVEEAGGHAGKFEVDAFFVRSRKDRRAWLNEPGISDEERTNRQRVITWWDLGRASSVLSRIRDGEHVQLDGLYDMQQGGEMVGTLDIDPGDKGYTVFVEGTALLVPELTPAIDSFVYLNTHDEARAGFLMERNLRDGYTPDESRARKVLTDAAETNEHIAGPLRQARFNQGQLAVLDNTHRGDKLRLMPPYIPEK
ncbi:MAG TPA: hypothetical protein VFT16_02490 [Candidatus Saccharimonadales bacterium]|nr:hypothetical protein [Candidatus Saccharimonadales bacterium]